MAQWQPAIKARILLEDGTTVLTPRAGSSHSDPFQVISISGVANWQPYIMDSTGGPTNALDRLSGQTEISDFELVLQDARVGGDNVERWVSAFFGNDAGEVQPHGLILEITRRMTTGGSYDPFWKGRIVNLTVPDPQEQGAIVIIRARDERIQEKRMLFVGAPHSDVEYAQPSPLCPIGGLLKDWGTRGTARPHFPSRALFQPWGKIREITNPVGPNYWALEQTDGDGSLRSQRDDTGLTEALARRADFIVYSSVLGIRYCPHLRVRITLADGSDSGDFFVCVTAPTRSNFDPYHGDPNRFAAIHVSRKPARVACFGLVAIPSGMDQGEHPLKYMAMPADDTLVQWTIYNAGPAAPDAPILLDYTHPASLLADSYAGNFSFLNDTGRDNDTNDGAIAFAGVPIDSGDFTTAESWAMDPVRFAITRPWKMEEFHAAITKQCHIVGVVNTDGTISPKDLRISEAVLSGITTITSADIVSGEWEHGQDVVGSVQIKRYADREIFFLEYDEDEIYKLPGHGISETSETTTLFTTKFGKVPATDLVIDAIGARFSGQVTDALDRRIFDPYDQHFGTGAATLRLNCRHTTTLAALTPGTWVIVDYAGPPDPATNTRDGARLMLCVHSRPDTFGPHIDLRFLDAGPNATATAPSIGVLAQNATTPKHVIDVPVTLNADDDPAELWVAVTETTEGTRPDVDDAAWTFMRRVEADATVELGNLPSGKRAWVRARSVVANAVGSGWVYSSGTDYVDTEILDPPTGLALTVDGRAVIAGWTIGESEYPLAVTLDDIEVARLAAGADRYVFDGLDDSTAYDFGVKHVDQFGGESALEEDTETTASANQLRNVYLVEIYQGSGEPFVRSLDGVTRRFAVGLDLGARATEPEATLRWQVSLVSNFASVEEDFITPAGQTRTSFYLSESQASVRYIRVRHERDAYTASANWSPVVSAYPVVLVVSDRAAVFAGGTAALTVNASDTIKLLVNMDDDGDSERFYYNTARDSGTFPTITTADSYIARSATPYNATLTVGGSSLQGGSELKLSGRFWSPISGFGQTVQQSVPATAAGVEIDLYFDEDGELHATIYASSRWESFKYTASNSAQPASAGSSAVDITIGTVYDLDTSTVVAIAGVGYITFQFFTDNGGTTGGSALIKKSLPRTNTITNARQLAASLRFFRVVTNTANWTAETGLAEEEGDRAYATDDYTAWLYTGGSWVPASSDYVYTPALVAAVVKAEHIDVIDLAAINATFTGTVKVIADAANAVTFRDSGDTADIGSIYGFSGGPYGTDSVGIAGPVGASIICTTADATPTYASAGDAITLLQDDFVEVSNDLVYKGKVVELGAADSGGVGYKLLRIAN